MEDKKRRNREIAQRMRDTFYSWKCLVCGADIEFEEQVGPSVYARPCGHYLWDGKARGPRPTSDKD